MSDVVGRFTVSIAAWEDVLQDRIAVCLAARPYQWRVGLWRQT